MLEVIAVVVIAVVAMVIVIIVQAHRYTGQVDDRFWVWFCVGWMIDLVLGSRDG
jgi:hypothetical protein